MSRDINKMHPKLKEKYFLFKQKMAEAGLDFTITSVDRTIIEQIALYAQGRMSLVDVNMIRAVARMPLLKEGKYKKVTWIILSPHVTNMFDTDLNNDLSRAFDFALKKYGVPHWQLKLDVNDNQIDDYIEAGKIAESVGLKSGYHFGDYCHCELTDEDSR